MAAHVRRKSGSKYLRLLNEARALPLSEQRRLRDELAKLTGVRLVRACTDSVAIRRGRKLADRIRAELAKSMSGTLDETMQSLRGRSWSS